MGAVRYILAFAVFIEHFNVLAGSDFYFPISSYNAVGGFFALSGFLIYGSYLRRPRLGHYLSRRALRILPAYFATVLFFAVGLYFLSGLNVSTYFGSFHFWKYILANLGFANFIEPTLPGVFTDNAIHAVNGSLWTMKVEWMLYLSVPCVAWLVFKSRRSITSVYISIYLLSAAYRIAFLWIFERTDNEIYSILGRQFLGQMMYFYTGVIIYVYFDMFRRYRTTTLVAAIALMLASYINEYTFVLLQPAGISAIVLWLSMTGLRAARKSRHDNVSYNIYLLHYPIIQLLVYYGLPDSIGKVPALLLATLIVFIASAALNICIEKPVRHLFNRQNN